jgi:hypothetical protein
MSGRGENTQHGTDGRGSSNQSSQPFGQPAKVSKSVRASKPVKKDQCLNIRTKNRTAFADIPRTRKKSKCFC